MDGMNRRCAESAYFARQDAGLTRERAAEIIDTSPRTLAYYESGRQIPDEIMARMVKAYNAPRLGYDYLQLSKTGQIILPELEFASAEALFIHLAVIMRESKDVPYRLEKVYDKQRLEGVDDIDTLTECVHILKEISAACLGVMFMQTKNPQQRAVCRGQVPHPKGQQRM